MADDDLYADTVALLRDVSANYHAASEIHDESGRPAMVREIAGVALRALDRLEAARGSAIAQEAINESGAAWLGEEILFRTERALAGRDHRQKYCAGCKEPAHIASAVFAEDWEKHLDDHGEEIVYCPDCRGSNRGNNLS
jgi:hypothetical protein